jgi:Phosphotransferase enzyme family
MTLIATGMAGPSEDQPTPEALIQWLTRPLVEELGGLYGGIQISFLSRAMAVADGTTVLLVRDGDGRPRAVVLCASPIAPNAVKHAMNRAHEARLALGDSLGNPILSPMMEGTVQGLSYAAIPYCDQLSNYRIVWRIQRALLCRTVLDWLWRANVWTLRKIDTQAKERDFVEPLRRLAALKSLSAELRAMADLAYGRLASGAWMPQHVLMHGDLWKGNILVRRPEDEDGFRSWPDRFAIIDWGGLKVHGYAIFDLVRLAHSLSVTRRILRNEVKRHCELLECNRADAKSYLLAALGHVYMNLEHFPLPRFIEMSEECIDTLNGALKA